MNSNSDKKRFMNKIKTWHIESCIVILIAGCMIFLINFTNTKLNQFSQLEKEAVLYTHTEDNPVHDQLAKEIVLYRPDVYKMIEIYTDDFIPMMTLQFDESVETIMNLYDYPNLIELFKTNKEGHTEIHLCDDEDIRQDIYFKWVEGNNNQKYLIITYSSYHPVTDLWVFNFIGYFVVILSFILLIKIRMNNYFDKITEYKKISNKRKEYL